jgi:hypothetical protein
MTLRTQRFSFAHLAFLAVLALALGASGCSWFEKAAEGPTPPCPEVSILADAAAISKFRDGAGRDLTDLLFEAEMTGVSGECQYDRKRTKVTINANLAVESARGAAERNGLADIAYFVAVVDLNKRILGRQEFDTRIEFPPNTSRVAIREELEQTISLKPGETGEAYRVLIGFIVDRDQLARNRTPR